MPIILTTLLGLYFALCFLLSIFQERLIFHPKILSKDYKYKFENSFEELNFKTADNKLINGLLFKAKNTKGLLFYLHGNAGALNTWGNVAQIYTPLGYDILIIDYRGYGKSEGKIESQEQIFNDNQFIYNQIIKQYKEEHITILGHSIGTGFASKLASENNPKQLILQAPYYSFTDLVQSKFPFIPSFILKYKLENNRYLKNCTMPITIFHGKKDNVINFESSLKLKKENKNKIDLLLLEKQGHNDIASSKKYLTEIQALLSQ